MQRPCFLFGAKEASTGEEYRGIRQRLPFSCKKTKTRRTARRRSSWSPRQCHHQSLSQAETAFVRIACTSCPPSNLPAVVVSHPDFHATKLKSINHAKMWFDKNFWVFLSLLRLNVWLMFASALKSNKSYNSYTPSPCSKLLNQWSCHVYRTLK